MGKYQWVLFDVDDTLLDFVHAARMAFSAMLQDFEVPEEPEYFSKYKECNNNAWTAYEKGVIDAQTLRGKRFADFKEKVGLPENLDPFDMNRSYLDNLIRHTVPLDGAMEILELLQKNAIQMGVITNGLREVQRPRIRLAGMEDFFKVVVVSDEIGIAKPNAGFFAHAYAEMRFPEKEKVLVVGDSFASDVIGARNFQLPSCWFNPSSSIPAGDERPDYEIRSLLDLSKILDI